MSARQSLPADWRFTEAMPAVPRIHPRHGPHDPTAGTPPRRPGSVRRTTTIDMLRPDENDLLGRLLLRGLARDLVTDPDGSARVVGEASMSVDLDFLDGRRILAIETTPDVPALRELVGTSAAAGFRRAVTRLDPTIATRLSLLHALLDDVPVATLVSAYATSRAGLKPADAVAAARGVDQCAGWRADGTIMLELRARETTPVVTGPPAPAVVGPEDPLAWHPTPPLPGTGMRRHRRMDLAPDPAAGDAIVADVLFRDSYQPEGGVEMALHEYTVRAGVDLATGRFVTVTADPRALPWQECPAATASAPRLDGTPVAEVRRRVGAEFRGATTCTHLNDTLRSLADVPALAELLTRGD